MSRHAQSTTSGRGLIATLGMLLITLISSAATLAAADLPFTAAWQNVPDAALPHLRWAQQLSNGTVLIINYDINGSYNKAKIYLFDPSDNSLDLQTTPSIFSGARAAWGTELTDGTVLIVTASTFSVGGGKSAIFNPANGNWQITGNLADGVHRFSSSLWADPDGGARLHTNKLNSSAVEAHLRMDPNTKQWTESEDHPGHFNGIIPLPDGNMIGTAQGALVMLDTTAMTTRTISTDNRAVSSRSVNQIRSGPQVVSIGTNEELDHWQPVTVELGSGALTVIDSIAKNADRVPTVGCTIPVNGVNFAGYISGESDAAARIHVYDHRDDTLHDLIDFPISGSGVFAYYVPLTDGMLMAVSGADKKLKIRRLVITPTGGGAPPPAMVADNLPTSITIDEGGLASFYWHLSGVIPTGGVDVVVERLNGSGDVQVVSGHEAHVDYDFQSFEVSLAGLIDADDRDDSAVLRLRVIQDDDSIDPNARTVTIRINDTITGETNLLPGDANNDGIVNADDLQAVIDNFGATLGGN